MARSGAAPSARYEVAETAKVPVVIDFSRTKADDGTPIPPGTRVTLHYGMEGAPGWQTTNMNRVGKTGKSRAKLDADEGTQVQFMFVLQYPDGSEHYVTNGGPWKNFSLIAEREEVDETAEAPTAGPTAAPTAATAAPARPGQNVAAQRAVVQKWIKGIMEGGSDQAKAAEVERNFRGLERELARVLRVTEDISPIVIQEVSKFIRTTKNLPRVLKMLFPDGQDPANFDELQERLDAGRQAYFEQVFEELRKDPEARKLFGLAEDAEYDAANPIGNDVQNRMFENYCNARCLGAVAPIITTSLRKFAETPAVDPALMAERRALMTTVMDSLPAAEQESVGREILNKVSTKNIAGVADVAANLGLAFIGGFWFTAAKGLTEGATGISTKDLVAFARDRDLKKLGKRLATNNALVAPFLDSRGFWKGLGARLGETLGRSIPYVNLAFSEARVGERFSYLKDPTGKGVVDAKLKAPNDKLLGANGSTILNRACEAALA